VCRGARRGDAVEPARARAMERCGPGEIAAHLASERRKGTRRDAARQIEDWGIRVRELVVRIYTRLQYVGRYMGLDAGALAGQGGGDQGRGAANHPRPRRPRRG